MCEDGGFTQALLGLSMFFQQNLRRTHARSKPNNLANRYSYMPATEVARSGKTKWSAELTKRNKRGVKVSQTLTVRATTNSWSSVSGECTYLEGSDTAAPLWFAVDIGSSKEAAGGFGFLALGIPVHRIAGARARRNLFVFSRVPCKRTKHTLVVSNNSLSPSMPSLRNIQASTITTTQRH